ERSGIEPLAGAVFERFGRRADAFKAGWAVAALGRLRAGTGYEQQRVASTVEQLAVDPSLLPVQLLRVLQQVASGEIRLPDDLAEDLLALAGEGADDVDGREPVAPLDGLRRWRAFANDGRAGPAEREVADVALRAHEARL